METQKIKVVTTGRDVITDAIFNIVKIGVYDETQEGFLSSLKDGIKDKFNRDAPDFECIAFDKIDQYTSQGRRHVVFAFACKEFERVSDGEDVVVTLIAGKVTFIRIIRSE